MTNSSKEQIDDLKRRGSVLIANNRLEEAKAIFSEIISRQPEDAEVWCQLGTINGRLGRIDEAGECSQRAIALRPNYSDAHFNLGIVLFRKGHHEEALAQYRNVLKINPDHEGAYFYIGQAEVALGRYDDAAENYRAAFRLGPSHKFGSLLKQQGQTLMQGDLLEQAKFLFKLLSEFFPNDPETWYALSTINGIQGNIDEAADCCQRVLVIEPDHLGAHINLGLARIQQRRLGEAAILFLKTLEKDPQAIAALNSLALTCVTRNHFNKYIQVYLNAVASLPDSTEARTVFMKTIENFIPEKYEPWLDDELKKCFAIKDIDYTPISLVAAHILKYKYNIDASNINNDDNIDATINQIACDDLFIAFLEKTINNDPELEIMLTKVRRTLLFRYCLENNLDNRERRVITALAHHCFNNEYVFATREDEDRQVNDLKNSIEERVSSLQSPSKALENDLLTYGMYGSLHTLSCREHLVGMPLTGWTDDFRLILTNTLLYPMEEKSIMADIGSIGTIRDSTSQLVQSQYEENPYPRWLAIPSTRKSNIRHILKQEFPHFNLPHFLRGPIRILVAGCGTGRHPIQTALYLSMNHEIEILAVDISKRSLAYAIRMARKYDVKNVKFLQGDILELSHVGKRFHIIECQGVLHHMENPIDGWRVLSNLLEENGLMSIGLYSKAGRASLAKIREMFKQEGLTPDNNSIRKFRARILNGEFGNIRNNSPDLYSLSGCRDLLFHFMEHQYTPRQLDSMMKELNLKFIGFTFEDVKIKNLYHKVFPQDVDMTNLSLWEEFENMYPGTFAKMYRFWCQKQ